MGNRKIYICDVLGQPVELNLIDNGDGTYSALTGDGAFTGTFDGEIGGNTPAAATFTNVDADTIGENTPPDATLAKLHLDTGTKTATATGGAATLNKMSGKITSESLTTVAGASYTLTLTNSAIAAADVVLASVARGTATHGTPCVTRVLAGAGSVTIVVQNVDGSAAIDGTIVISFAVIKD